MGPDIRVEHLCKHDVPCLKNVGRQLVPSATVESARNTAQFILQLAFEGIQHVILIKGCFISGRLHSTINKSIVRT